MHSASFSGIQVNNNEEEQRFLKIFYQISQNNENTKDLLQSKFKSQKTYIKDLQPPKSQSIYIACC